jgi:hypothetical protein
MISSNVSCWQKYMRRMGSLLYALPAVTWVMSVATSLGLAYGALRPIGIGLLRGNFSATV